MRTLNIDDEDPRELYGTITASDGVWNYYIYSRGSGDYELIRPLELATLTGPYRVVSAAGDFIVNISLMDRDLISADDEVSRGQIEWNVADHTNEFDKLQISTIHGKNGAAELSYVVFSNAAEAMMEIVLINANGESRADIFGEIVAKSSAMDQKIELFHQRETTSEYLKTRRDVPCPC